VILRECKAHVRALCCYRANDNDRDPHWCNVASLAHVATSPVSASSLQRSTIPTLEVFHSGTEFLNLVAESAILPFDSADVFDRTVEDLALARLGAVRQQSHNRGRTGLTSAVARAWLVVIAHQRDGARRATGSQRRDGLAEPFQMGIQVLTIAAFDRRVRDALALATTVRGCRRRFGVLVRFRRDEIIVTVVATRGFNVRGLARSAGMALDRIGICTRHGWAIDAHLLGGLLVRAGDGRVGVRVSDVALDSRREEMSVIWLIWNERFDGFLRRVEIGRRVHVHVGPRVICWETW